MANTQLATQEQLTPSSSRIVKAGATSSPVVNTETGTGVMGVDPGIYTSVYRNLNLDRKIFEAAIAESDLVRKIVQLPVDHSLANGINLLHEEDEVALIEERMEELNVLGALRQVEYDARHYGDGYLLLDDSTSILLDFSLDSYQAGSLTQLVNFNGYDLIPDQSSVVNVFGRGLIGEATVYMLRQNEQGAGQILEFSRPMVEYLPIPRTRLIRSSHLRPPNRGWFDSETAGVGLKTRAFCGLGLTQVVLHMVLTELEGGANSKRLMEQSSLMSMAVDALSSEDVYGDLSKQVMQYSSIARMLSNYGILVYEKGADPNRIQVNFSGLNDLLQKNIDRIALGLDCPLSIFNGAEATGLNASGESSTKRWSSKVSAFQRERLDPVLKVIFPIIAKDLGLPEINWKWNSWLPQTALDIEETRARAIENATKLKELLDSVEFMDDEEKQAMLRNAITGIFE